MKKRQRRPYSELTKRHDGSGRMKIFLMTLGAILAVSFVLGQLVPLQSIPQTVPVAAAPANDLNPPPVPKPEPVLVAFSYPKSIDTKPTVSVYLLGKVLKAYGSPFQDPKFLYDQSVKYGINPAYALAFYAHESGCGTKGEAVLTHSWGNERPNGPAEKSLDGYAYFEDTASALVHWLGLMRNLYIDSWGLTTPDAITPVYAPSADHNDPIAYAADLKEMVQSWNGQ